MKKKIRSIPPITSTGGRKVKNPSAPLSGLANISLGRYMSERKKLQEKDNDDTWDITKYSKSDFNKKNKKNNTKPMINDKPVSCTKTVLKENILTVTLEFENIKFLQTNFQFINATKSYFIPIEYKKEDSYLTLSLSGDILEFNVIYNEFGTNRSFVDEIYIPELGQIYDTLSMNVVLNDNKIIVTYKK